MNAITAPPKSVGAVASSWASAITSPSATRRRRSRRSGCRAGRDVGGDRADDLVRDRRRQRPVPVDDRRQTPASFATSWVTITLSAPSPTSTSFVWWSITRSMSVTTRPNDDALVTSFRPIVADVRRVRVAADDDVDLRVEAVRDLGDLRPAEVDALVDVRVGIGIRRRREDGIAGGFWKPPWWIRMTNARTPFSLRSFRTSALVVSTSSPEVEAGDARRRDDVGCPLEGEADERDLRVVDLPDLVRRAGRSRRSALRNTLAAR